MNKQTKNIISREWVAKELLFYNTADIRYALVLCGVFSLFFLPLTVLLIYSICSSYENVALEIFFSVILGTISSAPIWINILSLRKSFAERKMLKRGEFDVVTREVTDKSEKLIHRHLEEFLCFNDFKETTVDHTVFQLASVGDEFYIVHYKTKNTIKLLYPAKIYEYK